MSQDRDVLWLKYTNVCWTGGTPEQRRWAFDQWWNAEKADALLVRKAEKRKQAKAAHA